MLSGGGAVGQVLTSTGPDTPPVYSDPAQVVASSAFLNIKTAPYNAIGDGSTNDTAAISAADAVAARKFAPLGTYVTTLAPAALSGPFWGEGRIKDANGNLRAPNFANAKTAPGIAGNHGSIETAFKGDLSKCQFPVEHRITGAATLGQPATGYTYTPECFPHYTVMKNASGHNADTASNNGRTGAAAHFTVVEQEGQGDAMCYIGRAFVNSTRSGSTDFLANPAGVLFAGDVTSSVDGAYLNPVEINSIDNGKDCAAVGAVFNMLRTNRTGAKKVFWNGVRVQSSGSQPINSGFVLTGLADSAIDLTRATFTTHGVIKPAVLLKTGDCIMGDATPGTGYGDSSIGTALITYNPAAGWVLQTDGNPTLQVNASQALVKGALFVNPTGAATRLQVTDTTTLIGNTFAHQGATFGVFGATPQVQYPGWGTPTGHSLPLATNFNAGTATLAQCSAAVGCLIAYFKAVGFLTT